MYSQQDQSTPETKYPASLIEEALSDLPDELSEGVLAKLAQLAAEKKAGQELMAAQFYSAELAIAAHQNFAQDVPSMLDAIFWERGTYDTSRAVLSAYGKLSDQLKQQIPRSAIKFAACYFTQREILDEDEESIAKLLEPAGVTLEGVYNIFVDTLVEVHPDKPSYEKIKSSYPSMDDFYVSLPMGLPEVGIVLEQRMREDLVSAGFRLPELKADNTYGFVDDEGYTIPKVDESILPN